MKNHVNENIRHIRELKNLTQDYVADCLGISTRCYSKIETGETKITIDRLEEIGEVFHMRAIDIMGFNTTTIFNLESLIQNEKRCYENCKISNLLENNIKDLKEEIIFLKKTIEDKFA